jgi:hypothetical protein
MIKKSCGVDGKVGEHELNMIESPEIDSHIHGQLMEKGRSFLTSSGKTTTASGSELGFHAYSA